jgi:hypothetical protein
VTDRFGLAGSDVEGTGAQDFLTYSSSHVLVLDTMCHHNFDASWSRTAEEDETDDEEEKPSFASESTEADVELLTDGGDE